MDDLNALIDDITRVRRKDMACCLTSIVLACIILTLEVAFVAFIWQAIKHCFMKG